MSSLHRSHVIVASRPCHCCSFVVAIMVLPLHLSWFRCCHCSVTFTSVAVSSSPLQCRLRVGCGFVIAITVSPSSSHCGGVIVAVASLWCLHCHIVVVS